MKKNLICGIIVTVIALMMSSCSGDPIVGKWVPDNDTSGTMITQFDSNGTVKMMYDGDDGTYSLSGKWAYVEGSDNKITYKFNASTAKMNLDNPLTEMVIGEVLKEMSGKTVEMTLTDDGQTLYSEGGNGGLVKYE